MGPCRPMQNAWEHFQDPQVGPCLWPTCLAMVRAWTGTVQSCVQSVKGSSHWGQCSNASLTTLALYPLYVRAGYYEWMVQILRLCHLPCWDTSLYIFPSPLPCLPDIYLSSTTCHAFLPLRCPRMTFLQGTRSNTRPRYQLRPTGWRD